MNEETKSRTCANCACYFEQTAESVTQGFCRRNGPLSQEMAVEVPRMDRNGQPMIGKNDKPLMDRAQKMFYVYPPTLAKLVCFDGWRPLKTLPGESQDIRDERYLKGLIRLQADMDADRAAEIAGEAAALAANAQKN